MMRRIEALDAAMTAAQHDGLRQRGRLRIDAKTDWLTGVRVSVGHQPARLLRMD